MRRDIAIAFVVGLILGMVGIVYADTTLVRIEGHNAGDSDGSWAYGDVSLVGSDGVSVVAITETIDDAVYHIKADTDWLESNLDISATTTISQGGGTGGTYGTVTGNIDGSNQRFTVSTGFTAAGVMIYLNGVLQIPDGDDYTVVSSTQLDFTTPPPTGSTIIVVQ